MKVISATLEAGPGFHTVRDINPSYARVSCKSLADKPARLTERQASFYRNLISLAQSLGSDEIPVEFELVGRGPVFLDRGCIKMAEHAGFIEPLSDNGIGQLEAIYLRFDVTGKKSA